MKVRVIKLISPQRGKKCAENGALLDYMKGFEARFGVQIRIIYLQPKYFNDFFRNLDGRYTCNSP